MDTLARMEGILFETIFTSSNDVILILSPELNLTSINPRGMEFLGIGQDAIQSSFRDIDLFEEDTKDLFIRIFEGPKNENRVEGEAGLYFKDGRRVRVSYKLIQILNRKGKCDSLVLILTEISGSTGYTKEIEESLREFRLVVENLHEGLGILDRNDNILYANPAMLELFGYDREFLFGKNIADLVPEEEFKKIRQMSERWKGGLNERFETVILISNGEMRSILLSGTPRLNEAMEYNGYVGIFLDITEWKSSEKALKQSEEKYRATVEQSAENIYIYDIGSGSIVESNAALQNLLGYTADEMKTLKAKDFIAHANVNIKKKIDEILTKGKAIIGERIYKRKDGTLVNVEVSGSSITRGERKMLCIVSRDITERKRYQESLIEERNRAEFYLDLLAHDMGNILHGIKNGLDTFEMVRWDKEREKNTMNVVHSLADRSMKLARDVMNLSRIREDPKDIRPIQLNMILEQALNMALDGFPEMKTEVHMDVDQGLRIQAEDLLVEAFYNLFHNSIKVQESGVAVIGVSALKNPGGTRIDVWDHGGGMTEEIKDALFDRYSNPDRKVHTGIGMTIVHMLVKRYGGSIQVSDRIESGTVVGSNFRLFLPDASEA